MKKIWMIPILGFGMAVISVVGCSSSSTPSAPAAASNPSYEFKADGASFTSVSYSVGAATTWFGQTTSTTCTTSGSIISCITTTTGPVTYPPWTYDFTAAPGTAYSLQVCPLHSGGAQTVYLYKNGSLQNFEVQTGTVCPSISGTLP